jgi:hypothetical protein
MVDDAAVITAPEAPVTAPETTAAPTAPVVEAPPAAPVVTAPTTPRDPEQALRDAVGKAMDKVPGFEVTKPADKTPEQVAAEKVAADKVLADKAAADKAAADATKTPEQIAADAKAATDKAAADAKAKETQPETNPLDKLGPLPVEMLAKAITDNPDLAAALDKAGIDSELLYETSRRAALTDQFTEIFPTPEAATFASESAQHFYNLEENFPKIQNVEDFDKFVTGTMLPLSMLYDPQGKPLMNPDGKGYQTDGSIGRFMNAASQFETIGSVSAIDRLITEYSKRQDEDGEKLLEEAKDMRDAAVKLQTFRDAGYKLPGAKAQASQRSPEDQAAIDRADQIQRDAAKTTSDAQQKVDEAYQSSVLSDAATAASSMIVENLNRTSLNDNEKRFIATQVNSEGWQAVGANRHFQKQRDHLYSLPQSPENKKALVTLAKTTFEIAATKIMERLVTESGGKQISAKAAKLAKIEGQQANDKMNQGTGTTPGVKTAPVLSSTQVREQAIKNFQTRNKGSMPNDGEILAETMAIRGLGQRSA